MLINSIEKQDCFLKFRDFPGGPMVKNLPANSGDKGLNNSREDSTTRPMHHNYWTHTIEPHAPQQENPCNEKPPTWEAHELPLQSSPHLPQPEKAHTQQWGPSTTKNKIKIKF